MIIYCSVSPNLKSSVYLAGIKYGGLKEWEFMLKQYNLSLTPSSKDRYLSMLGETKDALLLNRYLYYANMVHYTYNLNFPLKYKPNFYD